MEIKEKADDKQNHIFLHSKCCNAHWELVFDIDTKKYKLLCEKCNVTLSEHDITVTGIDLSRTSCKCAFCSGSITEEPLT